MIYTSSKRHKYTINQLNKSLKLGTNEWARFSIYGWFDLWYSLKIKSIAKGFQKFRY